MDRPDPIEAIKRYAPKSLKVTLRDGTEKAVAVPQAGNRWARTSQVLGALQWTSIECLDKDGRVLGIVEGEEDDEVLEEFEEESGGSVAMARVLLEVMRTTMKEQRQLVDAQLRGNAELVGAMTEGMRAMSEAYRTALQVQQAHLMAPNSPEEGNEMMKMMQMAMMLQAGKPPTKVDGP